LAGRAAQVELLTPRGPAGIAVVEVRGPGCGALLERLLLPPGPRPVPGLCALRLGGRIVDGVLRVDRPDRASVELHLHGSEAVLAELERAVGGFVTTGASPAEVLLRQARSAEQLGLALEQLAFGPFDAALSRLAAMAPGPRRAEAAAIVERSRVAQALAAPQRCVLVGRQNAGKSTLLNRLSFRERALAGARPGLTRDPVREDVLLAGYPYELVDTAGRGPAADELDLRAQQAGERAAETGALVLLVADGGQAFGTVERALLPGAALVVRAKADLPQVRWDVEPRVPVVEVRALEPLASAAIRREIGAALRILRGLPPAPQRGVGGIAALSTDDLRRVEVLAAGP
jgi:tRNA modification GTPase